MPYIIFLVRSFYVVFSKREIFMLLFKIFILEDFDFDLKELLKANEKTRLNQIFNSYDFLDKLIFGIVIFSSLINPKARVFHHYNFKSNSIQDDFVRSI